MDLGGKTALVTGAAKRVGRAVALALAREGVSIAAHYNGSGEEAESLKKEAEALGVRCWLLKADFSRGGCDGLIERAASESGGLDMLVNNASIFPVNRLRDMTLEGLFENIRVNAWAPFVLARDFSKILKRGKVVNMLDSRVSGYDWSHVEYILSKHMLSELTRMMAVEFAPEVAVNGVAPGLILPPPGKDMAFLERMKKSVPLKAIGNPGEIASAVLYLLRADFLTGEVINVDGGRHLLEYDRGPHPD